MAKKNRVNIELVGDWKKAQDLLQNGGHRIGSALRQTLIQEAEFYRGKMVQGIISQAPAGKPFKPLSKMTLAMRKFRGFGGTKALIVSGELLNSIRVITTREGAFIGVPRNAKSKDGKSLISIAEIQEFGAGPYIIKITDKMRKFMFAAFRSQSLSQRSNTGSKSAKGVIIVRIPARPFIRPIAEAFGGKTGFDRFANRLVQNLNRVYGTL